MRHIQQASKRDSRSRHSYLFLPDAAQCGISYLSMWTFSQLLQHLLRPTIDVRFEFYLEAVQSKLPHLFVTPNQDAQVRFEGGTDLVTVLF